MKKVIWLWMIATLTCNNASASNIGVWPINPRIEFPSQSTLIWVKNNNKNDAVLLQARVFLWRQANNVDELIPQDDVVVSPPIVDVQAEKQQVFRVIKRTENKENPDQEKSYRVLIDEIPKDESLQESQLRFQMRYSLPLFIGQHKASQKSYIDQLQKMASHLSYKVTDSPEPQVEIHNNSNMHARLSKVIINNHIRKKSLVLSEGLLGYILPNASRRWPLTPEQHNLIQSESTLTFVQEHQELTINAAP